jgi:hypothetical protein
MDKNPKWKLAYDTILEIGLKYGKELVSVKDPITGDGLF